MLHFQQDLAVLEVPPLGCWAPLHLEWPLHPFPAEIHILRLTYSTNHGRAASTVTDRQYLVMVQPTRSVYSSTKPPFTVHSVIHCVNKSAGEKIRWCMNWTACLNCFMAQWERALQCRVRALVSYWNAFKRLFSGVPHNGRWQKHWKADGKSTLKASILLWWRMRKPSSGRKWERGTLGFKGPYDRTKYGPTFKNHRDTGLDEAVNHLHCGVCFLIYIHRADMSNLTLFMHV